MTIHTIKRFDREYAKLPKNVQALAEKQFTTLLKNPRHPSLHVKKMEGHLDLWEGRITIQYRFTFKIIGEVYLLRRIGKHDILKNP
ncbi:MAG: type II toxin-antitoxin system RelE/ParE family toxin [bacterium]